MLTVLSDQDIQLKQSIEKYYYFYPEFRRNGKLSKTNYWNVTSVLSKAESFQALLEFYRRYCIKMKDDIDVVVAVESKGFLIAPIIAAFMEKPFVPVRKKGKILGTTKQVAYQLEYGNDCLEIEIGSISCGQRVLVVDDYLATGGTLNAACKLVKEIEGVVVECFVVCTQSDLNGHENISVPVTTVLLL